MKMQPALERALGRRISEGVAAVLPANTTTAEMGMFLQLG